MPINMGEVGSIGRVASVIEKSTGKAIASIAPKFTKEMLSSSLRIAKGSEIRKVGELMEKFGGNAKDWIKKKGWDEAGQEWHWYENKGQRVGGKPAGDLDPF